MFDARRFRMYHVTNPATGTSRLIIRPTFDEDAGTYTVKVTGPQGDESSSAKLIPASESIFREGDLVSTNFFSAQFQNMQKKKVEQVQRKALVQELEEKQLKRMRPSQGGSVSGVQRGSVTYATSDDDVFYDAVRETRRRRP